MKDAKNFIIGIIAVIVFIVIVIAINSKSSNVAVRSNNSNQPKKTSGQSIKVGYIGPLTGAVAVLGIDASNAIEMAVEQKNASGGIDGKKIELYVEDDQYDTSKSIAAYEKLVNANGVETIIMSTYGGLMALGERAKKDNVMLVDSLDCDQDIANLSANVFCVAKETKDLADVIADAAIKQEYKKIGILHGKKDNFMPTVGLLFKERMGAKASVQLEGYSPETIDFKTSLLKFKDMDAIVFLGYDEIGIAMKQAKDLGIDKPFMTISSVATTPSIIDASRGAIEEIYFSHYKALDENKVATKFYSDFTAKVGRMPFVFNASDHGYDAATILFDKVLGEATANTKAERLQQKITAFSGVKDYPGVSGTLTMKEDGRISGILIRLFRLEDLKPVYQGNE